MSRPIATNRLGSSLENLENRSLPSAGVVANLTVLGLLRINGTTGADDITVRQADGNIWIDDTNIIFRGVPQESVAATSVKRIEIYGLAGDDIIFMSAAGQEVAVRTLVGAGLGNDWVYSGLGNDTLSGGPGDDQLFSSSGIDALYGYGGRDFLDDGDRTRSELVAGGLGFDWNADVVAIQGTKMVDVRQRESPTCSFLASLSGLARQGYDFREWISYDGVNEVGMPTYSVAFWNGTDWVWQSVEFNGTVFSSDPASAVEGESWVVLMNRAWSAYRGDDGAAFPHEAIFALTGEEATFAEYPTVPMGDAELNAILETLYQGGMVIAGTGPEEFLATDILIADHAYNVLQVFDFAGDIWFQMRNPMGFDGGATATGNSRDGIVYVTWDEFRESMTYLAQF